MIQNTSYNLLKTFSIQHIPLSLLIEITKRCNWKCGFCYAECGKNDGLDTETLFSVFEAFKNLGTFSITFTGGEPFLRKNIWTIIQYAKSLGFALNINTNGSLLHHFDIKKIAQYFATINISLHSLDPKKHNQIVGIKNAWQTTVHNLYELRKYNANVYINTLITRDIVSEYNDMKQFIISDLGFHWNPDIHINPTYSGDKNNITSFQLENEQFQKINKEIESIYSHQSDDVSISNGICRAGSATCFLDAEGYLYPCLSFKRNGKATLNGIKWLENVKEKTVEEIWKNNYMFKYLRSLSKESFKKCLTCPIYNSCFKCMAENYTETGSPIIPSEEHCRLEKSLHS